MNSVVISVIGLDSPGVVNVVATALSAKKCNIEAVTQTILLGQFAAIFVATLPDGVDMEETRQFIADAIAAKGLHQTVNVRAFEQHDDSHVEPSEPFVVTVTGPDRTDIIAAITLIFKAQNVNIENFKALLPEDNFGQCLLVFEIALPFCVDRSAFRRTLLSKGEDLGLLISIQHRDIFEALHRVSLR